MTRTKRFLVSAAAAATVALVPLSAEAFFGMMSAMMGGGWGGWGGPWGGWGYPYYGYGWGGWGYPYHGWGGYPYLGYPVVTAPVVVSQPTTSSAK